MKTKETAITELKLKCNKCKKKKATGFHQSIPVCTFCFIEKRMEKHPTQLKSYLQQREGGKY